MNGAAFHSAAPDPSTRPAGRRYRWRRIRLPTMCPDRRLQRVQTGRRAIAGRGDVVGDRIAGQLIALIADAVGVQNPRRRQCLARASPAGVVRAGRILPRHRHADHLHAAIDGELKRLPVVRLSSAHPQRHHRRLRRDTGPLALCAIPGDDAGARGAVAGLVDRVGVVGLEVVAVVRIMSRPVTSAIPGQWW